MHPTNRATYYIEGKGWLTPTLRPVSREDFKKHQAEKRAAPSSLTRAIQAFAMGILAVTQSMRVSQSLSASGVQVALSPLSLHLWLQIPIAYAQTTPPALPGPQGEDFQVNTYTTSNQSRPSVAALAGGGFVVTWDSLDQDGSGLGVYGQRFDGAGAKLGSEFQVNGYTEGDQSRASGVGLMRGNFVVTWQSNGQDGDGSGVYAQLFDGVGAKVGKEFQVHTHTLSSQESPSVAMLTSGGFVVVWDSYGQDGSGYSVYGQRFDGNGVKVGVDFLINSHKLSEQFVSSVVDLTNGGFVVAWQSRDQDGDSYGIYGQRFDGTGARADVEFPVNAYTAESQSTPSVAALKGGGFVVIWQSNRQDGYGFGIYGQRFDGSGAKVGNEFQVNTRSKNNQSNPCVASLTGGGFIVTWQSGEQDSSSWGVFGQRFESNGTKVGSEFQVNHYTRGIQSYPRVSALSGGGFVAIWQSEGQDGSGYGVYGRLFPANAISTVQPRTTSESGAGLAENTSQTIDSAGSQFQQTPTELPGDPGVTEPESRPTSLSTVQVKSQTSLTAADPMSSSDEATSQTPLIAGAAAGITALACSLFAGGFFFWKNRKENGEPSGDGHLEIGSISPTAGAGHPGSSGEYQRIAVGQSHYKDWPKGVPTNDGSHYHQNIKELNQQMAEAYDQIPTPQRSGGYPTSVPSHYGDLHQSNSGEMVSARL